jgi:aryl-alcohol dehydrogenase-like predicted oxidoreductase
MQAKLLLKLQRTHRRKGAKMEVQRRSTHACNRRQVLYTQRLFELERNQAKYSLMNRDVEQNGVLQTCGELGIGFVPWGPMGQGYLTVKIDAQTKFDPKMDVRSEFPRFSPEKHCSKYADG